VSVRGDFGLCARNFLAANVFVMKPSNRNEWSSRVYERWGALVLVGLAGAGIASVVMGFSIWFVALFCLLALVGAVDMLSTMSGGWEAARVVESTVSRRTRDGS
jgi:hypothetical protein